MTSNIMKLTVKTLNQKSIEVEIDSEETVRDLKGEISKQLGGDFVTERLRLIYAGTEMDDTEKISAFNITPDKFIVVTLLRDPAVKNNDNENNMAETNEELVTPIVSDIETNFLVGEDYQQAVNIMVEMGFERSNVEHAMAASFNNPERAFEYLTNGIPDHISQNSRTGSITNSQINAETVNQILELLRQNPNLLTATLEQMGITNTELLQQIQNNPDEFFNLMRQQHQNERNDGIGNGVNITPQQVITPSGLQEFHNNMDAAAAAANTGQSAVAGVASIGSVAGTQNFTPADHAAIERLKAMGFQEVLAVQAYVAFDKNEALAANFLATNIDEQN